MPNINDINGVTVANLAKLDAVLKANISKVNGLTLAAAFTGLLDTYTGAAAAYSTRKLKTGVTVAARIRRSGDDIEADVEFDSNNEISLTSPISNASSGTYTDLADFVDHSTTPRDAFVDEWKDQSGSGNHATQSTASKQPQIYDATTGIITANGKPAVDADAVDYSGFPISLGLSQPFTNFVVGENTDALGAARWYGFSPQMNAILNASVYAGNFLSTTVDLRGTEHMMWAVYNGTSSKLKAISPTTSQEVSGNAGTDTNFNYLLRRYDFDQGNTLRANEVIFWDSEQSSTDLSGIESSLNSEFLIYQPTDAPTSGLLATYTGAAAAYSVRQLSDKAVIAMRIRRDSDDEERNIGFDSNGDLDTTAISAFCGTANGYVVEWADQSTNGNNATQSTASAQPQIYNGTAVITENGKPCVSNWQSGTTILISSFGTTHSSVHVFSVSTDNQGSSTSGYIVSGNTSTNFRLGRNYNSKDIYMYDGKLPVSTTAAASGQALISATNETTPTVYFNGSSRSFNDTLNGNGMSGAYIGNHPTLSGGGQLDGNMQELIIYSAHQSSANRTGIETNINGYFSIF